MCTRRPGRQSRGAADRDRDDRHVLDHGAAARAGLRAVELGLAVALDEDPDDAAGLERVVDGAQRVAVGLAPAHREAAAPGDDRPEDRGRGRARPWPCSGSCAAAPGRPPGCPTTTRGWRRAAPARSRGTCSAPCTRGRSRTRHERAEHEPQHPPRAVVAGQLGRGHDAASTSREHALDGLGAPSAPDVSITWASGAGASCSASPRSRAAIVSPTSAGAEPEVGRPAQRRAPRATRSGTP